MKVVATVAVILVVLSVTTLGQAESDDDKKRILKNREECIAQTKVNPELIDRADRGDFVDDDKLKCFTKCFYQKAGFVTDDGALILDTIKAKIPANIDKEKALQVIEKCKQQGKDACETVYLVHKCYFLHTHLPETEKQPESKAEAVGPAVASASNDAQKKDIKSDDKESKVETKTESQQEAKKQ